ncbi:hypothetical protein DRE_06692 [Drechslerella stenobrocha 248]|uniref:Uncharacterized protein n=1 Tax=Drechslerella stenobrocha 248 TaxID=1043628 RepID=W7I6R6_9PEZI|nr:hypothetical protein DRE_06692 [Drechslerella stenobrocha 248]
MYPSRKLLFYIGVFYAIGLDNASGLIIRSAEHTVSLLNHQIQSCKDDICVNKDGLDLGALPAEPTGRAPGLQKRTGRIKKRPKKEEKETKKGKEKGTQKPPKKTSGSGKVPKKDVKLDPKTDQIRIAKERELIKNLLEINPEAHFGDSESDEYEHFNEEYEEEDFLETFTELGSEDEELYDAAIRRARSNQLFPETEGHVGQPYGFAGILIRQDSTVGHHPASFALQSLGIPAKVYSTGSPSFRVVDIIKKDDGRLLLRSMISLPHKHLVVFGGKSDQTTTNLAYWLSVCWRSGPLSAGRQEGGVYPLGAIPQTPSESLEWVTIHVGSKKTMTVLNRVAELPGTRLINYQDPQKKTGSGYHLDFGLLGQQHEDSEEAKALDALLGSSELNSIRHMLQRDPFEQYRTEIVSVSFLIDHDAKNPIATVLLQLLPQGPGPVSPPDQLMDTLVLDRQPPGIDPRLVITEHDLDPSYHPLAELSASSEASYFLVSGVYYSEEQQQSFQFWYSRLEKQLVVSGLNQISESEEPPHLGENLGHILNLAWTRQAGLIPILRITFMGVSAALQAFIKKEVELRQNGGPPVVGFDRESDPASLQAIAEKLQASGCREVKELLVLSTKGAENFGQFELSALHMGLHEVQGPFLYVALSYSHGAYSDVGYEKLYGLTEVPALTALRRGIRLKAEMEYLEPTYREDAAGYHHDLQNPGDQVDYQATDLAIGGRYIERFIFDSAAGRLAEMPDLIQTIVSWGTKYEGGQEDEVQAKWRARMTISLGGLGRHYSRYVLSVRPDDPEIGQDARSFELVVSQKAGNVVVTTKFPDFTDESDTNPTARDLGDAIWALWLKVDTSPSSRLYTGDYREMVKNRFTGLRFITILSPSDQTIVVLQAIYEHFGLNPEEIFIWAHKETGFDFPSANPTRRASLVQRVLLTLNGLPEVSTIEELCIRNFYRPFSALNYRRRVGAILVKWDGNVPQLVIGLGDFLFDAKVDDISEFKTLPYLRQRSDVAELTEAGSEIAWASTSSYLFELSDMVPERGKGEDWEYNAEDKGFAMIGCPADIKGFLHGLPFVSPSVRKSLTQQEASEITQLVTEEIVRPGQQGSMTGDPFFQSYRHYTYQRRYVPSQYEFLVRTWPYHIIIGTLGDGQAGPPVARRSARIDQLSRVYYDIFLRTTNFEEGVDPGTRWVSMRAHELSFATESLIRNIWNLMTFRIPGWSGFDVSFAGAPNNDPSSEDREEVFIGKVLLGLVEIGALGRMLADHAKSMRNLKISRIFINTAPDASGQADKSFQIFVMLRPEVYSDP